MVSLFIKQLIEGSSSRLGDDDVRSVVGDYVNVTLKIHNRDGSVETLEERAEVRNTFLQLFSEVEGSGWIHQFELVE